METWIPIPGTGIKVRVGKPEKALDPDARWPREVYKLGQKFTPGIERFLKSIEPLSLDEVARIYNSHAHLKSEKPVVAFGPVRVVKDALRDALLRSLEVGLDPQEQEAFQRLARELSSTGYSAGNNREATEAANEFNIAMGEVVFSRPSDPAIVNWARANSGRLIVEINDAVRNNIAGIVADGIRNQLGVPGTARRIRELIGLTTHQSNAALRYREELIRSGFGGSRLDQTYARYIKRKIRERAELIANNEIHVAVATGQNSKALALGRTLKDWITVGDNRVDPNICRPNEAMGKIPIGQAFPNSASMTTPGHIRCRCTNNYYGGSPSSVYRELRNPRGSTPTVNTPRPVKPPKPPKPPQPVVYGKADFAKLDEQFYQVELGASQSFYDAWNQHVKMSPTEFFGKLLSGVSNTKTGLLRLNYNSINNFTYTYNSSVDGISFTREIDFQKMVVDHAYFSVTDASQGAGIGKRLLGNSMELYERMGVKAIGVHANIDIGAYAWGKYGFSPTSVQQWQRLIRQVEQNLPALSQEQRNEVKWFLNAQAENPKALWKLSDMDQSVPVEGKKPTTVGKRLLIGTDWYGQLRLDDAEAVARFKAYVKK
jgi:hypothetical protein